MKTITRILGVALTVAMFIFLDACKAEKGDLGPIGPIGPTGANGTNGAIGATGATGATGAGTTGAKGDKGDKGDTGANGANGANGSKGDKGDKGDTGATGATGNANVIQVTFTATFVPDAGGRIFTFPSAITTTMLNTSAVHVYVQASNFPGTWYPIPGFVTGGLDNFRTYIDAPNRQVSVVRQSGTGVVSIISTRVVIIPANNLINGRKAAVDYNDYEAVKKYYNLPD